MPAPQVKRRFKRKLTPFLCQEMLYDYVVGALDVERKQAVEEFLPTDAETQRRLAAIKVGFVYTEKLSQFELKPSVLRRLNEAESVVQMGQRQAATVGGNLLERLHLRKQALRATAAVAGVVLLVIAASVVPWKSLVGRRSHGANNALELAPIQTTKGPVGEYGPMEVAGNGDQAPDGAAEPEGSGDEEDSSGDESSDEGIPQNLAAAPTALSFNVGVPVMNAASIQPAKPAAQTVAANSSESTAPADEGDSAADKKEAAPKGFVYRAFMTLDNIDDVADEITQKIEDLGGEKAGEVELGWKKSQGRYYHFAMPEANQEKLLDQLRAYGPVRISKDPHPRIMPKGRVRIILWVDTPR